jgi:hypothetical protein
MERIFFGGIALFVGFLFFAVIKLLVEGILDGTFSRDAGRETGDWYNEGGHGKV